MRKTVVCQLALGLTRVSGYTLYDHESMAFEETTPREVKNLIKRGVVNGLRLDKEGNIQLDEEGFNCKNLLVKSGVGNYRLLKPASGISNNGMFALTKVADTDTGMVYEVVSNQCARLPITEQKIKALYQLGCLTGCWVDEQTGMITFAKGVEMVDMTSDAIKEKQAREAQKEGESTGGCGNVDTDADAERDECNDGASGVDTAVGGCGCNHDCENPTEGRAEGSGGNDEEVIPERVINMLDKIADRSPDSEEFVEEVTPTIEQMFGLPEGVELPDATPINPVGDKDSIIFDALDEVDKEEPTDGEKTKTAKKSAKSSKKSKK